MKYKIIPEKVIEVLVEFLDRIQIKAVDEQDDKILHFCQNIINQLIDSDEAFDDHDEAEESLHDDDKTFEFYYLNENDFDLTEYLNSLNDDDLKSFYKEVQLYYKSLIDSRRQNEKNRDKKTEKSNEENSEEYKPTKYDKFEQYYLDREMKKAIKEAKTMDEMLYNLGLDLPPEDLN